MDETALDILCVPAALDASFERVEEAREEREEDEEDAGAGVLALVGGRPGGGVEGRGGGGEEGHLHGHWHGH